MVPQRQMPAGMEAVKMRSAQEAREAVEALGGRDRLSDKGILAGSPDEKSQWFENITELMDRHCDAVAVKDGSKVVGFMLVDHEGLIMQFWSPDDGRQSEILGSALALAMQERPVDHFTVKLDEHNEFVQIFVDAGFRQEETEDGKIVLVLRER